jgi:hypothetical protein
MSFKDKVEDFLKNNTPCWHISYDQFNFRLKGLHPKNPETDPNRIPAMHTVVKLLDEDQLYMVEEIQQHGLFNYEVDPITLKVKSRPKSSNPLPQSDFGTFVRVEFVSAIDRTNVDVGISILLERKELVMDLLTSEAKEVVSHLTTTDPQHKIRLYITEYNNPNRLFATVVIPISQFSTEGVATHPFDASELPEDVSIYYNKMFERINFEVK